MPSHPDPFRHVMVATDFSEASDAALLWASALGRRDLTRVSLVHAVHAPADRPLPDAVATEVERRLGVDRAALSREDITCETCFRAGKPWEVIIDLANELGPDLIILGRRGRSSYSRVGLGSTADRVIRKAPAPVLTVRRRDEPITGFDGPVVVAMDFSAEAGRAIRESVRLVRMLPETTRILLLHACDFPVEYGVSAGAEMIATARAEEAEEATLRLEAIASELRAEGFEVEVSVREGYAATIIEQRAEELEAGLIVLGTQGRSGLSHLMLGSVAERVLHHESAPVLTVNRTVVEMAEARAAKRSAAG